MLTVIPSVVGSASRSPDRSATVGSAGSSSMIDCGKRGSAITLFAVGEGDRLAADREGAPLPPADVVLGKEDPRQFRMAGEDDAEEVEGFALLEVGGREEVDAGGDLRRIGR